MKKIVIGILAHVDAGKTTLSESVLYKTGNIRKMGRVDHGDAFLDYNTQERSRGITIFSKQAVFSWKDTEFTLIDTPGHVDFSTEMERTLQILDYAIVVINGLDGVQSHTETIWNLLQHYQIPTFIFVNKMDASVANKETLLLDIQQRLAINCIDFTTDAEEIMENMALTNDGILDYFIQHQTITEDMIANSFFKRESYPCYFGSALKQENIVCLLDGLNDYTVEKKYPTSFGARIYKITRDSQGNRLTHLKITGGQLTVKEVLENGEKVDQIRKYIGDTYEMVPAIHAGEVCAIKGPISLLPGDGIGMEKSTMQPVLSSYMNYRMVLPNKVDTFSLFKQLQQLTEEDPQLHITYLEQSKEIRVQMMGEVQIEILQTLIKDRFHVAVTFDQGSIIYKETIADTVEGVGHFEPLRHYAEVHLLLEPGERNSGLQFSSVCKEEVLERNFQRLILNHLEEKEHPGVLGGFPITDIKITLLAGKAHLKHTEGGDFREATFRAIRQGLKSTKSILLEPYYQFHMEIPSEYISKAIYDIEEMHGQFTVEKDTGDIVILTGSAPIAHMQNYQSQITMYTKGRGKIICTPKGYQPCLTQETVLESLSYDSESDSQNPTGSIFCSRGAGFYVPWHEVPEYMHIPYLWKKEVEKKPKLSSTYRATSIDEDKELAYIFSRTYGSIKPKLSPKGNENAKQEQQCHKTLPECILIDGYNIIHSWPELQELAAHNLDVARTRLMDLVSNYQGYRQCTILIIFDAYKVKGNLGSIEKYHNIHIVYTKEAQTADSYIERATHQLSEKYTVLVATSDALEQLIVLGQGAHRISARELILEIEYVTQEKLEEFKRKEKKGYNYLLADIKNYSQK